MPKFGKRSKTNLKSCDKKIILVFKEVIKHFDCVIICGHRNEYDQNLAYYSNTSKLKFPQSKHNKFPSLAIDVAPYYTQKPHIRWNETKEFILLAGFIKGIAASKYISIRWGGDWNSDNDMKDNSFNDLVHYEIVE